MNRTGGRICQFESINLNDTHVNGKLWSNGCTVIINTSTGAIQIDGIPLIDISRRS